MQQTSTSVVQVIGGLIVTAVLLALVGGGLHLWEVTAESTSLFVQMARISAVSVFGIFIATVVIVFGAMMIKTESIGTK